MFQARSLVAENSGILFQLLFRYLAWMLPIAFYSMLITAVLIQSVREFFCRTWHFFWRYVTVFLFFQVIIFCITATASVDSLQLAGTELNGASIWYIFAGDFGFSLQASMDEVNAVVAGQISLFSKAGTLIGSLTSAASYRALTDIAIDHVWEDEKTPFCKRLAALFQDKSILLMIGMSILCTLVSIQLYVIESADQAGFLAMCVCIVFILGWLMTWYFFIKETKVMSYILTFAIMYYVEVVLADPTLNSPETWGVTVIITAARIICFTVVASMIAFYIKYSENYGYHENMTAEEREAAQVFMEGDIFKIISWCAKIYKKL